MKGVNRFSFTHSSTLTGYLLEYIPHYIIKVSPNQ